MLGNTSARYIELLQSFPPHTIRSDEDLSTTQAIIDKLIDSENLSPEELDYFNVLETLVHAYEIENIPIPDLTGVDLLKVLIEELGLKQKDLVPIFKTESIASAILNGKRKLTVEHIQKLADFF